jgi:hypothetical protein
VKIITHVAHLFDNKVISLPEPYRHHHLFRVMVGHPDLPRWDKRQGTPEVQGFLTSEGMFVDRLDALKLFQEYKQTEYDEPRSELYSENCWTTPGNWQAPVGDPARTLYDHNNARETILGLLKIEPFIGSTAPYRIDTIVADIFHREGLILNLNNYDFKTRYAKKLYSQIYEEPLDTGKAIERIQHYLNDLLLTDMEIKDVRQFTPRSSYTGTQEAHS